MEIKKQYTAPQLTVVTFKMERGYSSSILTQLTFWETADESAGNVEDYTQHDIWNDGNGFWN